MKRAAVFFFLALAAPAPAVAQIAGPQVTDPQVTGPTGPQAQASPGNRAAPAFQSERTRRLDELYARLREAEGPRQARAIELQIAMTLARSGSDTADILMGRARQAMQQQQPDLALSLLDAVVDLYPDYVEGWSRRAVVHFSRREIGRAISDIENVLRLEPRHFTAMVGLGMMLQQVGDEKSALAVFKRALEINPHVERVPQIILQLQPKVDGVEL